MLRSTIKIASLCVALVSCGNTTTETRPTLIALASAQASAPVVVGPLQFTVRTIIGPKNALEVEYTAKNVSSATVTFDNGDCEQDQRLYTAAGAKAFGRMPNGGFCAPSGIGGIRYSLAPGAQVSWLWPVAVSEILAAVPAGTYNFAVTLPNIRPVVEVSAGVFDVR